ncbi:hypothetical protein K227x_18790 [Rubripirellula lacrimiformis]|uniref:D-inositol-3-phosphate glycosyltransferase n=1 Tax=Rubripirellula lacrimiformis TaxID=1930273 RepID=A0A517N8M9_9BACT|nr:glycosyltransferase [Rubripirellula lacrimiformis]QDT03495.1 hypothetical protein K227x_18790 [Rubripirellula lacrimiformis]
MIIVKIIPNYSLGGIQKAGQVLATRLSKMGHQVVVIGAADGPRRSMIQADSEVECHVIPDEAGQQEFLSNLQPDVIHIHGPTYNEPLLLKLMSEARLSETLLVSTPVFGRPPENREILKTVKTCCVGIYSLYRISKWLGNPASQTNLGSNLDYVCMTPFSPSSPDRETPDHDSENAPGSRENSDFVIGRLGRAHPSKWRRDTESTINSILEQVPNSKWVSVGLPYKDQVNRLTKRWGTRFVNHDETTNYETLLKWVSRWDVQLFASPSGECFASSICEPAGLGIPTIALSNLIGDNGQSEQILDGVTGYLVGNQTQAISKLILLESNRHRLKTLKASTRLHTHQQWHQDVAAKKLIRLYSNWRGCSTEDSRPLEATVDEFTNDYHARMKKLHGGTFAGNARVSATLAALESWTVFNTIVRLKRAKNSLLPTNNAQKQIGPN